MSQPGLAGTLLNIELITCPSFFDICQVGGKVVKCCEIKPNQRNTVENCEVNDKETNCISRSKVFYGLVCILSMFKSTDQTKSIILNSFVFALSAFYHDHLSDCIWTGYKLMFSLLQWKLYISGLSDCLENSFWLNWRNMGFAAFHKKKLLS